MTLFSRFIFGLLFLPLFLNAQQRKLEMADIPLQWDQFTKTNQTIVRQHGAALIGLNSQYSWESKTKGNQTQINFTTVLSVKKETSLVSRPFLNRATEIEKYNLLNHEKGHLIIALIKNIWVEDALKQKQFTGQYKKELRAVYSAIEDKANELNNQYDEETTHSLDVVQQKAWESKLLSILSDLMGNRKSLPFSVNLQLNVLH